MRSFLLILVGLTAFGVLANPIPGGDPNNKYNPFGRYKAPKGKDEWGQDKVKPEDDYYDVNDPDIMQEQKENKGFEPVNDPNENDSADRPYFEQTGTFDGMTTNHAGENENAHWCCQFPGPHGRCIGWYEGCDRYQSYGCTWIPNGPVCYDNKWNELDSPEDNFNHFKGFVGGGLKGFTQLADWFNHGTYRHSKHWNSGKGIHPPGARGGILKALPAQDDPKHEQDKNHADPIDD